MDAVTVPYGVVIATDAAPALLAGATAVIWFALFTVKEVAAVPPNVTEVAPVRFVPAMTTLSPPAVVPALGVRLVRVGGAP